MPDPTTPDRRQLLRPEASSARAVGVLLSPRATYADVAARPRWAGALGLVLLRGRRGDARLLLDRGRAPGAARSAGPVDGIVRPAGDRRAVRAARADGAATSGYFGAAGQLVCLPLTALIVSGLAFAVFNAALGGDATFRQVFAVVVHSGRRRRAAAAVRRCRSTTRASRCRARRISPCSCRCSTRTRSRRGCSGSIDLFAIWWVVEPRHRAGRALPPAHRPDRARPARRVRRHRAGHCRASRRSLSGA